MGREDACASREEPAGSSLEEVNEEEEGCVVCKTVRGSQFGSQYMRWLGLGVVRDGQMAGTVTSPKRDTLADRLCRAQRWTRPIICGTPQENQNFVLHETKETARGRRTKGRKRKYVWK